MSLYVRDRVCVCVHERRRLAAPPPVPRLPSPVSRPPAALVSSLRSPPPLYISLIIPHVLFRVPFASLVDEPVGRCWSVLIRLSVCVCVCCFRARPPLLLLSPPNPGMRVQYRPPPSLLRHLLVPSRSTPRSAHAVRCSACPVSPSPPNGGPLDICTMSCLRPSGSHASLRSCLRLPPSAIPLPRLVRVHAVSSTRDPFPPPAPPHPPLPCAPMRVGAQGGTDEGHV